MIEQAVAYARAHREAFLEQFREFVAIPSVSTLSEHKPDMARTAEWLTAQLRALGMTRAEALPTGGPPAVYAEWLGAQGKPTVLVYGHYDVQPVDPIDEWASPPFEPTVRGENVYARGASDDKGQILAVLKAVEALVEQGPLPVNLKCIFEGEEEVGSPHLGAFIEKHRELLACDFVMNCDASILGPDAPAITYALRGLAYFEVEVRGPAKDLHSGGFGGAIHNPIQVLCELIAGMHHADGRIALPGFYDSVRPLADEERAALAKLNQDDEQVLEMSGAPALWGEQGYTVTERLGARPSLCINGILGGFTGEGSKTVLPARAMAKVSMRLVPDQEPEAVHEQLCAYLRANAPNTVTWAVRELAHGPGAVMDRTSPWMEAAVAALREVFGAGPVFRREGGSVPVVGMMQQLLGADSVMLGFALPDDGIHGPNEKQHLPTWFRGIETYIRFLASL
ncbi:MAG: dipeptidase [Candidatus Hydrogenedentes bacterium]|nr:dipeptidase [Candidatus Hydrogenedentota bacterium]